MLHQKQIDIIVESMMPYHPIVIGIFGSVARGEDDKDSDIDIMYRFRDVIGLSKFLNLQEYLEEELGKKVDLVDGKYIDPFIKEDVMNELKVIYNDEGQ
ncbi:MAG: nucleotidyltransferase domain-containing protein [Tannerellaceae bacterium]|jgi:predicted nucleotidyltransferase|nr:nucleotidyltransferase domain-containing protein [Tannerellaceae bacterium]